MRAVKAGAVASIAATIAYDLSRYILVTFGQMTYWPFKTFPIFGRLIAGEHLSLTEAYVVGTVYHCVNGLMFSIAYCLIFGYRHVGFAVAWALLLEATVLWLYPGWLGMDALMAEFTAVSVIGHICFGLGLGFVSRWMLKPLAGTP
jgi:hypothetical protein